ncbi:protein AF1q [Sebastes umbrosus]|uniref:protein AF1q n=1 Tax=Sebastes umbrosus TaxID=72105 RepID=UPI0018A11631|nr:protein AF1q [Sebastes umbrosus]
MMEKSKSQYDSFLFWRQPIPALDLSELEGLGLNGGQPANRKAGKDKSSSLRKQEKEEEIPEFSSFNYWRAPIADVGTLLADFNLLL